MKLITIFIFKMLFFLSAVNATAIPSTTSSADLSTTVALPAEMITYISKLKIKEIQKLTGRKLTIKEKIAFKLFQWKIKKGPNGSNRGRTALIFSIVGLLSLLIPVIGVLTFVVFTTLALITGYQAKKEDPDDKNAKTAIVLSWLGITLLLTVLVALVAIVLRS